MGFLLLLKLLILDDMAPIKYKQEFLKTGTITDSNIKVGETLKQGKEVFFQGEIRDKKLTKNTRRNRPINCWWKWMKCG